MAENLAELLGELFEVVVEVVDDNDEPVEQGDVLYLSTECEEYDYEEVVNAGYRGESPPQAGLNIEQNREHKKEIPFSVKSELFFEPVSETPEYSSAVAKLRKELTGRDDLPRFGPNVELPKGAQIEFLLNRFIMEIVDECLDVGVENAQNTKLNIISSLVREIEGPKISYHVESYYRGIYLEYDRIWITNDILLKRPESEDFELEKDFDRDLHSNKRSQPKLPPSLKISFECKRTTYNGALEEEKIIISLLRLFAANGGDTIGRRVQPNTPLRTATVGWENTTNGNGSLTNYLNTDDRDKYHLRKFFQYVEEPYLNEIHESDDDNYLTIAYDRFESALINPGSQEASIASAVMGLEALFLKNNENGELSERLAQRCGILMECSGHPSMEVYQKLKSAYSVRSKYVHGSKVGDENVGELAMRVIGMLKQSLIFFLQISQDLDKQEIISKMDSGIMTVNGRENFNDLVESKCGYMPHDRI